MDNDRHFRLHQIIEYLKLMEFCHDTFDINETGIIQILAEYGILETFNTKERQVLKGALLEMGEQNEFQEVTRLVRIEFGDVMCMDELPA